MPPFTFSTSTPFATGTIETVALLNRGFGNSMALKQGDQALDVLTGLQVDVTSTGTVNDHNPGSGTGVVIRCNNASALKVTGAVPHLDGQILIYENAGASTLQFTNQDAGSAAANRFALATSSQWIGVAGSIGFQYDGTSDRWRVLFINPGVAITRAYAGGNYVGNGAQTWTVDSGDIQHETFWQHAGMLWFNFTYATTSVGGTPNSQLITTVPGGLTVVGNTLTVIRITDNSATAWVAGLAQANGTQIIFYKDLIATNNWAASTNLTYLHGQVCFPVS